MADFEECLRQCSRFLGVVLHRRHTFRSISSVTVVNGVSILLAVCMFIPPPFVCVTSDRTISKMAT